MGTNIQAIATNIYDFGTNIWCWAGAAESVR